jgi:hypothetical protein
VLVTVAMLSFDTVLSVSLLVTVLSEEILHVVVLSPGELVHRVQVGVFTQVITLQ